MTGPLALRSAAAPDRMAAIEARFGLARDLRRPSDAFDSVLSAQAGDTAPPEAGGAGAPTANLGTAALPASLLTAARTDPARADHAPAGTGAGAATSSDAASTAAGQAVVEAARTHLGVPYLWGGTDPAQGFDCSGLIQNAYRQIGVELPKWSRHQATMGIEVASIDEALPGDILTFGHPVSHVALYLGDRQMLHAPKRGEVVKIEEIDRTIGSIRRIVTPDGAPSPAPPTPTDDPGGSPYRSLFEAAGARWNVEPALLAAVAQVESGFDPSAVSPAGARGLMQFMPATAAEMGVDPLDPASAIDGAARYLRTSLDQFPDVAQAVASYNAGRGAVQRYGGVPPYRETRNYVDKVLEAWRARS